MSDPSPLRESPSDDAYLRSLGYEEGFDRSVSLWSNFALGFLYLSPLVGIIALFGLGLTTAGPPVFWWILIAAGGQFLVSLVFGEVVSQYPIAGGLYQWARRLWSGSYAWMLSWIYIAGVIIGITTTALFSADFVQALLNGNAADPGTASTPGQKFVIAIVVTLVGLLLNATGSKTLARIAKVGLAAELGGIILVGLYLLVFERHNSVSVFFDTMGTGGTGGYASPFLASALVGLLLFYGFEACGEVAEETPNPGRTIPRSMQMTVLIGGAAALFAFVGYVLAAPDLQGIVNGDITNPIPVILQSTLGTVGTKIFLVVALTSFLACVMGQQAAASRLIFSFARDDMFPRSAWFSRLSPRTHVPVNALIAANVLPVGLYVFIYFSPDSLLRIAAFQMLAGYFAFQMVVLASMRARRKGWRPAGRFSLGRAGWPVSVSALAYGVFAMVLLAKPSGDGSLPFYDRWISLIGFLVVAGTGLTYLLVMKPSRGSSAPEGDAVEVARQLRASHSTSTHSTAALTDSTAALTERTIHG
ncbi:amino acid permease [Streptomyces sp. HC44]|uniref:Amino acid permease n=1 Tax=Streptomyces scabichelini TaxID=2711217 RepID=A0A6G4UYP6_9ACTN|nr:amino acid permease [Streptomyces scabichelini]NGO06908.1 amino acid permease [Streptomyces scabichelini]